MSGPYDLSSDDRLAQAFREVFQMKCEFDLAEEVRKANAQWAMTEEQRNYARLGEDARCPTCSKRGVTECNCEGGR